jgi:hypothetical protein
MSLSATSSPSPTMAAGNQKSKIKNQKSKIKNQ